MRVICLILVFVAVDLEAAPSILIRQKPSSLALQQGDYEPEIQTKTFRSEQEKADFIRNLDTQNYEWEENQIYTADDFSIQSKFEKEVATDPLLANQWSLYQSNSDPDQYSGVDIDAVRAWDITRGSDKVIIFVMDSGIDDRDPDLKSRVIAGYDATSPGRFPFDDNSHGTHVASISSASGENNYGIKGVVPGDIKLVIVKFLDKSNQGSTDYAVRGLKWMAEFIKDWEAQHPNEKYRYIGSNSWGGAYSGMIEDGVRKLTGYGYLPVTSAGNHGRNNDQIPYFPCNFKVTGNLCVGATDQSDKRTAFSGFGSETVHLFAPGMRILGVVPGSLSGDDFQSKYETKDGTSQAVPHVAGAAALVWAANPSLSPSEVQDIIVRSADRLPGGGSESISGGRLNVYRAALMATGQDPSKADRASTFEDSGGGGGCALQMPVSREPKNSNALSSIFIGLIILLLGFGLRANMHLRESQKSICNQRNLSSKS